MSVAASVLVRWKSALLQTTLMEPDFVVVFWNIRNHLEIVWVFGQKCPLLAQRTRTRTSARTQECQKEGEERRGKGKMEKRGKGGKRREQEVKGVKGGEKGKQREGKGRNR